jgi:hypothetical protein
MKFFFFFKKRRRYMMAQIKISITRGFYICRERTREGTQSLVVCESVGWRSEVGSEASDGDGRKRFCDGEAVLRRRWGSATVMGKIWAWLVKKGKNRRRVAGERTRGRRGFCLIPAKRRRFTFIFF